MRLSMLALLRSGGGFVRLSILCACLALLCLWSLNHAGHLRQSFNEQFTASQLPCGSFAGRDEILLILRTGATEIENKFPVHTTTTLRCFPHHIIFSDYEEDFLGERILDALEFVDPNIVAHHDDFELYRRLKRKGRKGLAPSELSGVPNAQVLNQAGHSEIPGWKLDKWKFPPMVNRTLHEYPDMKWYVFVEADTSILSSTLHAYLARSDHTKPCYLGFDTFIGGECVFAHGGSGLIVSRPALQAVVDFYSAHKAELEAFTQDTWAGDYVLGKAFKDSGVAFTGIWPLVHGESTGHTIFAGTQDPALPKEYMQVWCYPAATYHHMAAAAIESLWHFEQQWLQNRRADTEVLRHKDVFKYYVMPQMSTTRMDWDNMSENEEKDVSSFEECRAACERESTCKQYSYEKAGLCKTRINPRLGIPTKSTRSGWIEDRIIAFERDMTPCGDEGFDTLPGPL